MACKHLQFLDLPTEIISKILLFCPIKEICVLSETCKKLKDCSRADYVWCHKWKQLASTSGLFFSNPAVFPDLVFYRDDKHGHLARCRRLWKVCYRAGVGLKSLPFCIHCGERTCTSICLDTWERKVSLDIGSKTTWLLTTTFALQRHPSVLISPNPRQTHHVACTKKLLSGPCDCGPWHKDGEVLQPFCCILCEQEKKSVVVASGYNPSRNKCSSHQDNSNIVFHAPIANGDIASHDKGEFSDIPYLVSEKTEKDSAIDMCMWFDVQTLCSETYPSAEVISLEDCFVSDGQFEVFKYYTHHILERFHMLEEVQKPNVSFVFCEPHNTTILLRQNVARFLFEDLQVSRLCLLNKGLAAASLIGMDTCLVIDSGASNTVVTLVIDGRVETERTRRCPVGGFTIGQYLADSIRVKGIADNISVASLDTSRVKSCCYLSYNISVEEKRKSTVKHNVFVRCRRPTDPPGQSRLEKLELGSELYVAPELMYRSTQLPKVIKEVLLNLEPNIVKDALGHILLTGSNTELNGFATRLIRDLQIALPEYSYFISIHTYAGSRSWDAVMGATRIQFPFVDHHDTTLSCSVPGSVMWVTREDYILYGSSLFDI